MKEYYILKKQNKEGPYSLEELKAQSIFPHTIILKKGSENPRTAFKLKELSSLFEKVSAQNAVQNIKTKLPMSGLENLKEPPKEYDLVPGTTKVDYSQIEDIAGVDYKKAIYITAAFIALNIFFKEDAVLGFFGIVLSTTLVVFVWMYFKKYFDAMKDTSTANWIQWIIGAHILFGISNMFSSAHSSISSIGSFVTEDEKVIQGFGFMVIGIIVSTLIVFISGFKILAANKKHPFPLKRIAISTMILVPLYMIISLIENMPISKELVWIFGGDDFETGPIFNAILMLPFFFLLHHFYRADTEDATPD